MLFGTQTGESFSHYLRNTRLDEAATRLTSTDESVKAIWVAVGYNHASNFDHDFKQRFGVPPREYRARGIRLHASSRPFAQRLTDAPTDSRRVALIDENVTTLDTIARHLRIKGYDVAVASTGAEGWRAIADGAVQAIVLDYHLPDIDGIEWLRGVRRQWPSLGAKALIFTADWELVDRVAEMRALDALFASKLCDLDELERLVASLCAQQRPTDPRT